MNISIISEDTSILSILKDDKSIISLNNIEFKNVCNIQYVDGACTFDCEGGSCEWKVPMRPDALFEKPKYSKEPWIEPAIYGILHNRKRSGSNYMIMDESNKSPYWLHEDLELVGMSNAPKNKNRYELEGSEYIFVIDTSSLKLVSTLCNKEFEFYKKQNSYNWNTWNAWKEFDEYIILLNDKTKKYLIMEVDEYKKKLKTWEKKKFRNDKNYLYTYDDETQFFILNKDTGYGTTFDISDIIHIETNYEKHEVKIIYKKNPYDSFYISYVSDKWIDEFISYILKHHPYVKCRGARLISNSRILYIKTNPNNHTFLYVDDKEKYNVNFGGNEKGHITINYNNDKEYIRMTKEKDYENRSPSFESIVDSLRSYFEIDK